MEQFGMSRQLRLPGQQKDRFWRAVVLCALTAAVFSTMQAISTASRSAFTGT